MQSFHLKTVAEQLADFLRKELLNGRWTGQLPGVVRLATECDVSTGVVRIALRQLEEEGHLTPQGLGRCRCIAAAGSAKNLRPLRVGILLHDPLRDEGSIQVSRSMLSIQHRLEAAGHTVVFGKKSQVELQHDVSRITRLMNETGADAWVVASGSRGLLEWCATQTVPILALYGRSGGLKLARTGPDKMPAYLAATRHLISLGHQRIVLITRRARREPTPGVVEREFLKELRSHGISVGNYNLPDWIETPEGFTALLEKLFRVTPPTALIIEETNRFIAAMQFLADQRIGVPSQVSMISTERESVIDWCNPRIANMTWSEDLIIRRVIRWVGGVQRGVNDYQTINFPAEYDPGGTVGPVCEARVKRSFAWSA